MSGPGDSLPVSPESLSGALGRLLCYALAVALLAYLAWAFPRSRDYARSATCQNNVRCAANALLAYCCDWERYPPSPKIAPAYRLEDGRVRGSAGLKGFFPADDWHRLCEYYDYRNWGHGHRRGFICPSTRSIYAYRFNAHLYGLTPSQALGPDYRGYPMGTTIAVYETGFLTGTPAGPHLRGYNVAYCDGHAKWLSGPEPSR